jgi:hypothetical protein
MEMSRRQPAVIIEPQTLSQLSFAAFAYSDKRVVSNQAECLAPNFEPVGGASFLRVEYRDASRVLKRHESYWADQQYPSQCSDNCAPLRACNRHRCHGYNHSRHRRSG